MQKYNVFNVPENDLFLVEDVNWHMATRVQIIQLVRCKHLHLLYKLLFSVNQALDQLAKERMNFTTTECESTSME